MKLPNWLKQKRFWIPSVIVIVLTLFFVVRGNPNDTGEVKGEQVRRVDTLTIATQDSLESSLFLKGEVLPKQRTLLRSRVNATLQSLAPIGSQVSRGQQIARLSDRGIEDSYLSALGSFRETEALSQTSVQQSKLNQNSALASLQLAEANLNQVKNLNAQNLASAKDTASVAYEASYNLIEQVLRTWGGGTLSDFILESTPTANKVLLNQAETDFFGLKLTFNILAPKPSANLNASLSNIEQVLGQAKDFNELIFRVLSFSIASPTSALSQNLVDNYTAQANAFIGQVNSQNASLKSAKNGLSQIELANSSALLAAENQLRQAEIQKDNAVATQTSAERQAEISELSASSRLTSARTPFDDLSLEAPFSGVIISHRANIGDQVILGQELLELGQIAAVEIDLLIDESSSKLINLGQEVLIDGLVTGLITEIAPAASLSTGKIGITIAADNQSGQLTGGDIVEVEIDLRLEKSDAVVIPLNTVTVSQTEIFVYVIEDSKVAKRIVALGEILDSRVEIQEGLNEGDQLILTSGEFIAVGEEVEVKE